MQPSDFACTHLLPYFILREFTVVDAVEYFYIEIFNFVKRISAAYVTTWCEKVAWETLEETTVSLHTERNLNEMNAESKQLCVFCCTQRKTFRDMHFSAVRSDFPLLRFASSAGCLIMQTCARHNNNNNKKTTGGKKKSTATPKIENE